MIVLEFQINNLNASLQVGDAVYARPTVTQLGSYDAEAGLPAVIFNQVQNFTIPTGQLNYIGVLRKIENPQQGIYHLYVEELDKYDLNPGDFIMFSKFSYGDSGLLGYYAKAKFTNNSNVRAELFAVSSEVIINSK